MLTLIHTQDAMYVTKRRVPDWRAHREAFAGYLTSLDGFSPEALIDHLEFEYPDGPATPPGANWRAIVTQFVAAPALDTIRL